jgi:hypothetical protein
MRMPRRTWHFRPSRPFPCGLPPLPTRLRTPRSPCPALHSMLFQLLAGLPQEQLGQVASIAFDGTSATALLVDRDSGALLAPAKLYNEAQGAAAVQAAKVGGWVGVGMQGPWNGGRRWGRCGGVPAKLYDEAQGAAAVQAAKVCVYKGLGRCCRDYLPLMLSLLYSALMYIHMGDYADGLFRNGSNCHRRTWPPPPTPPPPPPPPCASC